MRTGTGLIVVGIGAILAFAVTSSPSFFNIQIAGWVIMGVGVVGMLLSRRRDYSQLLRWFRPRARVVQHNTEPRALDPSQVIPPSTDAGAPPADARPSADGATADRTVPGAAQHVEDGANGHPQNGPGSQPR